MRQEAVVDRESNDRSSGIRPVCVNMWQRMGWAKSSLFPFHNWRELNSSHIY